MAQADDQVRATRGVGLIRPERIVAKRGLDIRAGEDRR
jgi:hypothetical protein